MNIGKMSEYGVVMNITDVSAMSADSVYTYCYYSMVDRRLAEERIGQLGDAYCAYEMVRCCGSDREWAEPIVKKAGDAYWAYLMVKRCGSDREWAEAIIEKAGDAGRAYIMVKYCGSSQEWANKVSAK